MKYFYSLAFGLASSLLLTASVNNVYGKTDHNISINRSIHHYSALNHSAEETTPINMKNGSISANLVKWNLNTQEAEQHFNRWLGLDGNYSFQKIAEKTDKQGIVHSSYQQYYKNIPVDNNLLLLHSKNGKAQYLNGRISTLTNVNIAFSISPETALNNAKQVYQIQQLVEEYPAVKTIVEISDENGTQYKAAYKLKLASTSPLVLRNVYMDAQSGEMIQSINLIQDSHTEGTGLTLYEGEQDINIDSHEDTYRLYDLERNIQTFDAKNLSISWIGFNGLEDIVAHGPYFNSISLEDFVLESVGGLDSGSLFLRIKDSSGNNLYSSVPFSVSTLPRTFNNINLSIYSFNDDYMVEVWEKNYTDGDELVFTFQMDLNSGTHDYSENGDEVTYSIAEKGNPAVDVHWGMGKVLDFYNENFDWNSYDNQGSKVEQFINPPSDFMGQDIGMPNNAFALQDPFNLMVYGLGDGYNLSPLVSLDIAGHEFTHLIIGKNGNGGLNYQGEPGALNESFADIFGTCIEFYASDHPNWEIGDDVVIIADNLRSLENPKNPTGLSYQPDTYMGQYWMNTNSNYDNGGVHTNSGVQNYWFYLLTEGGTGTNDLSNEYAVEGIGMDKSKFIAFNNVMNYLSPNASYYDAYVGSMQVANNLHGLPSFEYTQTAKAWYAVGIADNPEEYCAGTEVLTDEEGYIEDGSGDLTYVNNAHCSWLIQPEDAEFISISFRKFKTEEGADFVVVYDGVDSSAPVLGEFSGNELPEDLISTGGAIFIEFYTDQETRTDGWKLKYAANKMGVTKNELQNQLTIFPNPTNGNFNISSQLTEEVSMEVYDISGKLINPSVKISKGNNNQNLSHLNSGIYFLKFSSGQNTFTEKLIIQ